jgi:tetratricopeptide (TPR) repeat protein
LERTFDHYLHTLIAIHATHQASHRPLPNEPLMTPGTCPEVFEDLSAVHDWFRAEQNVLRAVIAHSEAQNFDRHTWQLAWIAFDLIDRFGPWRDWLWVLGSAERAAARIGEHQHAAKMMFFGAVVCSRLGGFEESRSRFEAASRAYAELGDVAGQVRCQSGIAWALVLMDRPHESLKVAEAAFELQRHDVSASAQRVGMALHQVVEGLMAVGDFHKALERCAELVALRRGTANPYDRAHEIHTEGVIFLRLGEFDKAVEALTTSVGLFEQAGSWSDVVSAQRWLGEAHQGVGDIAEARRRWIEALTTLEYHQHPHADLVRAKLAALPEN